MNNKFPPLNLEKFAHGYRSFYDSTLHILEVADKKGVLEHLVNDNINSLYKYSSEYRGGYSLLSFLKNTCLTGDQEASLSFFNEILPRVKEYEGMDGWELRKIDNTGWLGIVTSELISLSEKTNNSSVFNIDFYYDTKKFVFKRKLDDVTVESVNFNNKNLDGANNVRYQECVSDFLSYNKSSIKTNKFFYNESLDKLKRVVENTLQNKYKRADGSFPKISGAKGIANILFDDNNVDFENLISYITKNIHHEEGGTPRNFSEKEYIYLWLELNKILYLLNRYKK